MTPVELMASAIHVAARTADLQDALGISRFEPCAGCGIYHRLIRRGPIWMQPQHDCEATR